jgi:hypothetical protein
MGEVIHVDFSAAKTRAMSSAERYLEICKEALDENDFLDLMDAIRDPVFYQVCDEDIQDFVDGYFAAQTG